MIFSISSHSRSNVFGLGAVKRQKSFPPVPLTTQLERNDAQTHRLWSRRGFNPEKKTGRDVSDQILLDCTGLEENPIRNVSKKTMPIVSPMPKSANYLKYTTVRSVCQSFSKHLCITNCYRSTRKICIGNSPGHEDDTRTRKTG